MIKKIVLTGGGTAGHVMPHLAILDSIKKDYEIHYLGSSGIEKEIISKYPFVKYYEIPCAKLIRSFTLKNLAIPYKLLKGISTSKKIIKQINPQVVFSKGGFVAVPVVIAASKLKVPVISHESDITLGLANKINLKYSTVMCCSFEKTVKQCKNKGVFTGSPIRNELFFANKQNAYNQAGFKVEKPTILFMGGSLGAKYINQVVVSSLDVLLKDYNIIHIVGKNNLTHTKKQGYFELEFTNNIGDFLALSDMVVSRAGSNSINEFLALNKPMLLIPLPLDQSRGDQLLNAKEFEQKKYCQVLLQENLTKESLLEHIQSTLKNKKTYIENFKQTKVKQANQLIVSLIKKYSL